MPKLAQLEKRQSWDSVSRCALPTVSTSTSPGPALGKQTQHCTPVSQSPPTQGWGPITAGLCPSPGDLCCGTSGWAGAATPHRLAAAHQTRHQACRHYRLILWAEEQRPSPRMCWHTMASRIPYPRKCTSALQAPRCLLEWSRWPVCRHGDELRMGV